MDRIGRRWDGLTIAAFILVPSPEILTSLYGGWPDDLGAWEQAISLSLSALILGAPQLVLFAFVRAAQPGALRVLSLLASVGLLFVYARFVTTVDLASDAQAGAAFYFFQLYVAAAVAAAGGIILAIGRFLSRKRRGS